MASEPRRDARDSARLRRPDGPCLDAATCTSTTCVISEVFRTKARSTRPPPVRGEARPGQLRGTTRPASTTCSRRSANSWRLARPRRREERLPAARRGRRAANAPRRARVVRDDADGPGGGFGRVASGRWWRRGLSLPGAGPRQGDVRRRRLSHREEKATAALRRRAAEAEVKATLEKAKEDAEAATGASTGRRAPWMTTRRRFTGRTTREDEAKEYKYPDESAPMYESIEEADAAFEAAQKQKEADEGARRGGGGGARRRPGEVTRKATGTGTPAAAGRPGRALRAALHRGGRDSHAAAQAPSTDDEPSPPAAEAPRRTRRRSTPRWARWAPVCRARPDRAATTRNRKKSRLRAFPLRRAGSSRWWTRTGTVLDRARGAKHGRRSLARSRRASIGGFHRFGVFDELRRRRGRGCCWAARRSVARARRRGGDPAAGGAAVVAGAFAVTASAKRRTASDAECVPLIADGV